MLHRLREHLNVPGSSSVDKEPLTRELRRLLSRLNETSGGFFFSSIAPEILPYVSFPCEIFFVYLLIFFFFCISLLILSQ